MRLFGFELIKEKKPELPTFVPPQTDDGAVNLAAGASYGQYVDLDGSVRSEAELINKYRQMAEHPEVETAIDDIVNEMIVLDDGNEIIKIILDALTQLPPDLKQAIITEFEEAKRLIEFNTHAYEIVKRWYVDGRLYFHVMIDPNTPQAGIQELRYVDPRKIRKIREIKRRRHAETNIAIQDEPTLEYYIFNDKGFFVPTYGSVSAGTSSGISSGIRITKDSIIQITSGIASVKGDMILSYLHKAIKPLNMLRTMEDSLVIYRITRAPERRIFYIDVGNLPKVKAEQYLRDVMAKFKNRVVYDSTTGEVRDDRKILSMTEDFWLPRRENGRGTEISTLPGGQNLNQIEDIMYFQRKLFNSLNVPITRLEPEQGFGIGRATEVSRDEVKFSKFIKRLRLKFSTLFTKIIGKNLVLKGVMSVEQWDQISQYLKYQFAKDNYYDELKNAEVMSNRMQLLGAVQPFVGMYFSSNWVKRNVLKQDDLEIEQLEEEIMAEMQQQQEAQQAQQDQDQQSEDQQQQQQSPRVYGSAFSSQPTQMGKK